jgi:putative phosphonate transport system ATP-binding protein
LLNALALRSEIDGGALTYTTREGEALDLSTLAEARKRLLSRTEWGFVHQNARDGLRRNVSAGANIGEPLMAIGARHYGRLRETAADWMSRVELDAARIDELPSAFSGGMQQRLQIARNLVTGPRLVFMDEPTAGLDVSVQARLLDLLRTLTSKLHLAAVIVTHDIGVARLLAHRLMVMKDGRVVESGLTDQVLDDPQHPYTQTLVASVLPV